MLAALQGEPPLSVLEEQLMGCRTLKSQGIPFVDTSASLAVLDGYSEKERRVAEAYTAALADCTDFACLKKANKLVGGGVGVGECDGASWWAAAVPSPVCAACAWVQRCVACVQATWDMKVAGADPPADTAIHALAAAARPRPVPLSDLLPAGIPQGVLPAAQQAGVCAAAVGSGALLRHALRR